MKRSILLTSICAVGLSITSFAQKKNFSYTELFENSYPAIGMRLPAIQGWADDDHYLEVRRGDGAPDKEMLMSVEAKSGNAIPYVKQDQPIVITASYRHGTEDKTHNITSSPDGKWIAYTRDNDLYSLELATGKETRLTSDGSESVLNGYASWLYYEEILKRVSEYRAFWWSPDSKQIAYMRFDDSKVPVFPIYRENGQHGYLENQRYPKAGDPNPQVKIGITTVSDPQTVWADFDQSADQYFGKPYWSPDNELWTQWMNRSQDSLIVYRIDKTNGSRKQVLLETQSTWITLSELNRIRFLSGNKGFILKSDKDGWENFYLYTINGQLINQITTGTFWGSEILAVDEKAKTLIFKARKDNPARFDLYKIGLNGKGLTRLSSGAFSYDQVFVSPTGKYFIAAYSNVSNPPVMVLADRKGNIVRQLGNAKGVEFNDYALPKTVLVKVKSSDSLFDLPMAITYPLNFDPNKKYPVLISIYGGPDYSNVFDRWKWITPYGQWWAQEGLVQVTMDNRSSGHFGKKGENYVARQLGKWEIEDFMDCGRWIRRQQWADTASIALTGSSFGGYMTCMALTYGSAVFTHGIAVSSVTDWQLYDSHYTERFMKTPAQNPQGYRNTSVMTYADRYKGMLRIVHGTADDNVHVQNSLQLIEALEDKGKNFEMMFYPGERHGFAKEKQAHQMVDINRFIYRYLLKKEFPPAFGN